MDMLALMNSLLGAVQSRISVNAAEIELATISLAFVIICARSLNQAWANGYDRAIPFMKDQATKFLIVVALAMPLPILGGSFITTFPQLVVSAGMSAASGSVAGGNFAATVNAEIDAMRSGEAELQERLARCWKDLRGDPRINRWLGGIPSVGDIIYWIGMSVLVLCVLLPFILMSVGLGAIGLVQALALVLLSLWIGLEISAPIDPGHPGAAAINGPLSLIAACSQLACDFVFKAVLIFTFLGVMISICIKSVIYVVLFPFAFVNMAFESRRQFFIDNIAKGFQIALSAVVAGIMFHVCLQAYVLFAASGGPVAAVQQQFLGPQPPYVNGGWIAPLGYVVKSLMISIVGPSALCIPIVRFMTKSGEVAAGLVGGGSFMGSTGLSGAIAGRVPGVGKQAR